MEKEFRYQYIVDGEALDQVTADSRLAIIKCILAMNWQEEEINRFRIEKDLLEYLNRDP